MRTLAFWLSLVMIFVSPWENIIDVKAVGSIGKAIGLLAAMFWLVMVVNTGKLRKPHPFHLVVFLFVLWNAVSVFWSVNVDITVERAVTYIQLFSLIYMVWDIYTTPAALKAGLQAYVLGGYVSISSVIANYESGVQESYQRYTATGFNGNDFSLILTLGMPLAWYLATSEGNGRLAHLLRLVNYAYIPVAFVAISLTASRAAVFATIPAFLYGLGSLTRLKFHVRLLIFAVLIGSMFVVAPLIPETSIQRIADTGNQVAKGDFNNRTSVWQEAIAIFSEHSVIGVGSGAFRTAAIETNKVAHNFVLTFLAEIGIIGFGLFVIILVMVVYQIRYLSKWHAILWLTVLSIWLIGAVTHNWETRKQTWLFFILIINSSNLYVWHDESGTWGVRQYPQIIAMKRERSLP